MPKSCIAFFTLLFFVTSYGQKADSSLMLLRNTETELKDLQKDVFYSRKEADRLAANKKFIQKWDQIVADPKLLQYPFDSLKEVSIIFPVDKRFKLITWNVPKDDGTHAFFGYLLVNNSKKIKKGLFGREIIHSYETYKLVDRSGTIKNPETYTGTPDKWFGMLYYSIIESGDFYTLLAWDGNDKLTQRKFVDILYFKADGTPVFGKDVFKFAKKNPRRLMFEYSTEVSMSLKFHEKQKRIVYSHLAPKQEGSLLEGQYQYYGPDGSFDALEFHKGKWVTVEDIDARNEKNKNDKAEKPDPNKQTPVFKPK
jgi:hypothetical protein